MRISERQVGDVIVLDLAGPLYGWQAASVMEQTIRRHCRSGTQIIVVNLGRVGAIDCGGLGALVDGYNTMREAGGEMRLASVTKRINDLLVITRLLTVFDTFDSVEEAVEGRVPAYCGVPEASRLSAKSLGTIHAFLRQV
jgi:anti-sigma B factor antagonist